MKPIVLWIDQDALQFVPVVRYITKSREYQLCTVSTLADAVLRIQNVKLDQPCCLILDSVMQIGGFSASIPDSVLYPDHPLHTDSGINTETSIQSTSHTGALLFDLIPNADEWYPKTVVLSEFPKSVLLKNSFPSSIANYFTKDELAEEQRWIEFCDVIRRIVDGEVQNMNPIDGQAP